MTSKDETPLFEQFAGSNDAATLRRRLAEIVVASSSVEGISVDVESLLLAVNASHEPTRLRRAE